MHRREPPPNVAARWFENVERAAALRDRLGMPMDAGIVPTVAALWLNDLPTSGSCWGHAHRAANSPWVILAPLDGQDYATLRARVDGLVAVFTEPRRPRPHRRLVTMTLHSAVPELDGELVPTEVRIGPRFDREVRRGDRERLRADLRSARREMTAFTDFLIAEAARAASQGGSSCPDDPPWTPRRAASRTERRTPGP